MGNVAGVVSWDLEKSQNLLIDNQAAVAIQNADVLALARQIIDEHNSHEVVVAAAALAEAANANDAPSEQGRRVELVKTLQEALADADVTVRTLVDEGAARRGVAEGGGGIAMVEMLNFVV